MSVYDEEFARQVKRRKIPTQDDLLCHLCTSNHVNTASEYEYPCLILNDWICETHCVEITEAPIDDRWIDPASKIDPLSEEDLHYTLKLVYKSLGCESLESIGVKDGYERLRETCNRCPYHGVPG